MIKNRHNLPVVYVSFYWGVNINLYCDNTDLNNIFYSSSFHTKAISYMYKVLEYKLGNY